MFLNCEIVAIANGDPPSSSLVSSLLNSKKKLVAIDGGLNICDQFHLKPDLILGDFDSVSSDLLSKYSDIPQVNLPDQTKCDLQKALEYLVSHSAPSVTVLGATGQRIDHTLTNICLLCLYPVKVKIETEKEQLFALPSNTFLPCKRNQTLSLIPMGDVINVKTSGLKWDLNGETLNKHFIGISNIALQESVSISFEKGDLIVSLIKEL